MSYTLSIRNSMIGGGVTANDTRSITADNVIQASESIAAGKAGTAGLAGVMTMGSHDFTDSDIVSVYWSTGFRYGCAVSSYDGTTITVNGATGAGDTLPTAGSVVVAKAVEIDLAFSGSASVAISIGADIICGATLEDAGGVELAKNIAANGAYQWDSGNGESNPVTGDAIIKSNIYNKSTTAGTAVLLVGYNNA